MTTARQSPNCRRHEFTRLFAVLSSITPPATTVAPGNILWNKLHEPESATHPLTCRAQPQNFCAAPQPAYP